MKLRIVTMAAAMVLLVGTVMSLPEAVMAEGDDELQCTRPMFKATDVVNYELGGYEEFLHEDPVTMYDIPVTKEDQQKIMEICEMYELDVRIILAQLFQESGFNRYCIGDHGKAIGISQIQPRWHRDRMARLGVSEEDLLIIEKSVLVQCDFMSELIRKYEGDYRKALTVYRYGSLNATEEDYASIVFGFAEELEEVNGR